ncbi:hypothetical protein QO010_000832 [Caulobacter ginsengisoli]|uniref:DUF3617 domain-containing protein n=1 Tax=Caulobacter ginsengisoli TaxID=400775 RepID=A0ABU0IM87_9CAUL|nr:hypothetical protein [Caulobacter ginsengisoli]MDQ0463084.1 hypothetical protein [Caulobacter ginsengisoli]
MIVRSMAIAAAVALAGASTGLAQDRLGTWDCEPGSAAGLRWILAPGFAQQEMAAGELTTGSGYARVQCELNASGRPKDCIVLMESAAGKGFGAYAAELAGMYKAASKDSAGQPTKGRRVCRAFGVSGKSDGGPTG